MNQSQQKQQAAEFVIDHIEFGSIVGVGTGSTVNYFIDALAKIENKIDGTVASSNATKKRLESHGIPVLELADAYPLSIYVDGADEATKHLHLIKGGGGALTWEKILASAAEKFYCIADQSKLVDRLGAFPLPIEVIPMAKALVAKEIIKLGGSPELRTNFTTDNGNIILDVKNMDIENPIQMEKTINQIPGVVTVGLFACRPADILLIGTDHGVKLLEP